MNVQEYQHILAERAVVQKMLDEMPKDLLIDRMSMESRLQVLDERINAVPAPNREPIRAKLTFRGKPVIRSHGVFAEFGTNAVSAFSTAVATIGASLKGALGERGSLKDRDSYQLLITGTALGSFGFELEESTIPEHPTLFPEDSDVENALNKTIEIIEALPGTDEVLSEALSDADDRAVDRFRDFLDVLVKHEAICALEVGARTARFLDVGQVQRAAARLMQDNIREKEIEVPGCFEGVLPSARTFEFSKADGDSVLRGKVGRDIEDAAVINELLKKPVRAKLRQRRVGDGRPRYVLLSYEVVAE